MAKLTRRIVQGEPRPIVIFYHDKDEPARAQSIAVSKDYPLPGLPIARWGSGDGQIDEVRIDGSTNALIIVENEHHEIHEGEHYFVTGYQDPAINEVLDFTWQMPNTTKWIHWTWKISVENETLWEIYENVAVINPLANAIAPFNSNRNSANLSATLMRYELQGSLAAANADTNVGGATLLETGIAGAGRDAGNEERDNEIILKQNTIYCLRAIATAAGYINFGMQWYEHTGKH